jgi:predicted GNAT superfamily acetyltransferase
LQVEWWLTSPRVRTRIDGGRRPPDLADYLAAGTQKLNPASLDARDLPQPCENPRNPEGSLALVELPPDIRTLESTDPALASAWRAHLHQLLGEAFRQGYLATDFLHLKGERFPRSYYLLSHGQAAIGE